MEFTNFTCYIMWFTARFVEELNTFDDQQMPESTLILVEPYLKKSSFDPTALQKKSGNNACGGLCRWVHGVVRSI